MESADSDGALTPLIDDEPVKELDGAKAVAEAAKKTADSAEAFMVLTVYNKMDCARLSFASCVSCQDIHAPHLSHLHAPHLPLGRIAKAPTHPDQ